MLNFEGLRINQPMSTKKGVACRRLMSKAPDTQKGWASPKGCGSGGGEGGEGEDHRAWVEGGRTKGIHFQSDVELLLEE